ncbi:MAG TPA: S41 family peptidase [Armatimonadota bacterium]|jgi:carboxyl-terminal processing protease
MKHTHTKYFHSAIVTLLVLTAFLLGYQLNDLHTSGLTPAWAAMIPTGRGATLSDTVSLKPIQLFQEALTTVQEEYVDPIKNTDELTYAAIRGMLQQIHDPYTRFMDPKEFKEFSDENAGHFAGIGATLKMTEIPSVKSENGAVPKEAIVCPVCRTKITDINDFHITVVEPLPGTPAKAAGIMPADYIMKIDGVSTDGMTVSDAADKIRGPKDTKVTLTIQRAGESKPLEITITRDTIEVPAVESKMLDGKIGYLRLLSFNEKTVEQTRAALLDFNQAHIRGLVLDLRSNPGGLLTECIKVASMLLPPEDKVIVSTKGRSLVKHDETRVGNQIYSGPMVVMVNKGSASASEILTGALKDYHRAKSIGETTFGKALVQTVIRLGDPDNPCAMPVTTAHYTTPVGFDLNKKGIAPDVTVELSKDAKELSDHDNQAQAALGILKEEMAKDK